MMFLRVMVLSKVLPVTQLLFDRGTGSVDLLMSVWGDLAGNIFYFRGIAVEN